MSNLRALVVGCPFPVTGGGRRCYEVVKRYSKFGIVPYFALIWPRNLRNYAVAARILNSLGQYGVKFLPLPSPFRRSQLKFRVKKPWFLNEANLLLQTSRYASQLIQLIKDKGLNFDFVIGQHECLDTVYMTHLIAKKLGLYSIVMLQSPPFYQKSDKILVLKRFSELKFSLLSRYYKLLRIVFRELMGISIRPQFDKLKFSALLKRLDLLLSVSESIGYEMGGHWSRQVKTVKPSLAVDDIIKRFKKRPFHKKNHVVYYCRLVPEKGIYELPFIWRNFLRYVDRSYRLLVIGGFGSSYVRRIFQVLVKRLGVEDSIHVLGYMEGRRLFTTVAEAKALLYPSHIDSFSLVVLESLSLGTPVVSYDIPAIRFNYSNVEGIKMVPEFDLEAMAQKLSELVEKPPRFKRIETPTWDQVAQAEIETILSRN